MSMGATLSIMGLYNYDNSLFDDLVLPEGFTQADRELTINNIILECGELETCYTDFDFLKWAIGMWSGKENITWSRIYRASLLEYNPIENYNRTEKTTISDDGSDTHSGNDVSANTGSDSYTGTDTVTGSDGNTHVEKVTGYDSGTLATRGENTDSGTINRSNTSGGSTTYGGRNTFTHGEKIDRENEREIDSNISGNIGVTTSQQMLEQEIDIAEKLNLITIISLSFRNRFCLLVY